MKTTKRILSMLLCLALVIGFIPTFTTPARAAETTLATFTFGEKSAGTWSDGQSFTSKSYVVNGYTLNLTSGNKVYSGGYNDAGRGFIKFGTSNGTGSLTFTVPEDVTQVDLQLAKYKTNTSYCSVNGTTKNLTNAGNNSAGFDSKYDVVSVDTSTQKTVTVATTNSGKRMVMFAVIFYGTSAEPDVPDTPACEHTNTEPRDVVAATCITPGYSGDTYCTDCGDKLTTGTVIPATGHADADENKICDACSANLNFTVGTVTFDVDTKRTEYDADHQTWTENSIIVTNNKSASTSNVNNSFNPVRFYANSELIVKAPGKISQIVFDCNSNDYATALGNSIKDSTVDKDKVTILLNGSEDTFTVAKLSAQVRMDALTVTYVYDESVCMHENTDYNKTTTTHTKCCADCPVELEDAEFHDINGENGTCSVCAYAVDTNVLFPAILDAAYALAPDASMSGDVTLTGVITNIGYAATSSTGTATVDIVVGGDTARPIQAYRLASGTATDVSALAVGDTITVTGTIKNYTKGSGDTATQVIEFDGCTLKAHVPHEHDYTTYEAAEIGCIGTCGICGQKSADTEHVDENADKLCDRCNSEIACTHVWAVKHENGEHIKYCSVEGCGVVETTEYVITTQYNADGHWEACSCGEYTTEAVPHTLENGYCECGYSIFLKETVIAEKLEMPNDTVFTEYTTGKITISADKGSNNNSSPAYFDTGKALRIYYKNVLTITPAEGYRIVSITFTTADGDYLMDSTTTVFGNATATGLDTTTVIATPVHATQPVTLTKDATKGHYRIVSIEVVYEEVIPCEEHTYDEGVVTTEPTCTEAGIKTLTCSACGATKTDEIAALGHAWDDGVITTNPTCTAEGVKTFTCGTCNETKTEVVTATGHSYEESVTAPTCTEAGYTTYTCACGDTYKDNEVAATGHSYTYTDNGENHTVGCSKCDLSETEAHNFVDGTCVCGAVEKATVANAYLNVNKGIIRLQELMKLGFYYQLQTEETILETGAIVWTADEYAAETVFDINHTTGTVYPGQYESTAYYSIETNGIPAQSVDTIVYILPYVKTENGYAYAATIKNNSILKIAKNQYTKADTEQDVKDIIADVMNYATAARAYFVAKGEMEPAAEPFNVFLSESDKVLAWSDELLVAKANDKIVETSSSYAPAAYKVFVNIEESLKIQFVFADTSVVGGMYWRSKDYTDNSVHDDSTKTGETDIDVQGEYVSCYINGINAYNIYDDYYVRGYNENGELTKTYTNGIAAYLSKQISDYQNSAKAEDQALVHLCKAMLIYGKNALENDAVNKG